jgi:hypothetical protein
MSRLIQIADWSGEKRANVVFVHGLGGHPSDTWRRSRTDDTLWPLWLAEDVKGLSVFSFGHISPATNWPGTAMPLLDEATNALRLLLNDPRLRDGLTVFVCHSLGGLIVKQILRAAMNNEAIQKQPISWLVSDRLFLLPPRIADPARPPLSKSWVSGLGDRFRPANNPELRDRVAIHI